MLIQGNALFAPQNLNVLAAYGAIISETNLPSCTMDPSPCLLYQTANKFLGSSQFPFLQAVLERVELTPDNLSLRNIFIIKNNNSSLDDEIVYRAFVKNMGYVTRILTNETWEEWTEYKTPLGRVVSNFLEYAFNQEEQKAKLVKRSQPWIELANKEAQRLIKDLQRPLMEKIEMLRSDYCYDKAKNAELKGCDTQEIGALISNALPRALEARTTRFNIKKDCCRVKMVHLNDETVKVKISDKETGIPCTGDTHLVTAIGFYRYGDNIPGNCVIKKI